MKGILSIEDITNCKNKECTDKEKIVNNAQKIGANELTKYSKIVDNFIDELKKMSVFKQILDDVLEEQIRAFLIDEILNLFIKPIFQGNRPAFMSNEDYLEIRKNMYDEIIKNNNLK